MTRALFIVLFCGMLVTGVSAQDAFPRLDLPMSGTFSTEVVVTYPLITPVKSRYDGSVYMPVTNSQLRCTPGEVNGTFNMARFVNASGEFVNPMVNAASPCDIEIPLIYNGVEVYPGIIVESVSYMTIDGQTTETRQPLACPSSFVPMLALEECSKV